jgi:hypothetical protein
MLSSYLLTLLFDEGICQSSAQADFRTRLGDPQTVLLTKNV